MKEYKSVKLKDEEYEYASIADLTKQHTQEITFLEFSTNDPELYLNLRRDFSNMMILYSKDMTSAALWTKIDNILSHRTSPLEKLRSPWIPLALSVVYLVITLISLYKHIHPTYLSGIVLYLFVFLVVFVYQLYLRKRRWVIIYLAPQPRLSIWSERANIIALLSLLAAVMGIIVTVVLSK